MLERVAADRAASALTRIPLAALKLQLVRDQTRLRKIYGPSGGEQIRNWYYSQRASLKRAIALGALPMQMQQEKHSSEGATSMTSSTANSSDTDAGDKALAALDERIEEGNAGAEGKPGDKVLGDLDDWYDAKVLEWKRILQEAISDAKATAKNEAAREKQAVADFDEQLKQQKAAQAKKLADDAAR